MTEPIGVIIIGGGPGGYVAAIRGAQLGGKITLIESDNVGGSCLNHGCIPSKTLIHIVEMKNLIQKAGEFGIEIQGEPIFNLQKVLHRKRKIIETQIKGIHSILQNHGIKYLQGKARLIDHRHVVVITTNGNKIDLTANRIILATGSTPTRPSIFPFNA